MGAKAFGDAFFEKNAVLCRECRKPVDPSGLPPLEFQGTQEFLGVLEFQDTLEFLGTQEFTGTLEFMGALELLGTQAFLPVSAEIS